MSTTSTTEYPIRTEPEARAILRVSDATLTRLLDSGELPSFRIGRRRFVTQAAIDAFLAAAIAAGGAV